MNSSKLQLHINNKMETRIQRLEFERSTLWVGRGVVSYEPFLPYSSLFIVALQSPYCRLLPYASPLTSLLWSLLVTYQAFHLPMHFCGENMPSGSYLKARSLILLPYHTKTRFFTTACAVWTLKNFTVDILSRYRSRKTRADKCSGLCVDCWGRGIACGDGVLA